MGSNQYSVGETVGLEIEHDRIVGDQLRGILPREWQMTRDASVESDVTCLFGIPIELQGDFTALIATAIKQRLTNYTLGVELVSIPLAYDSTLSRKIDFITSALEEAGACCTSTRAGMHIHVGMPMHLNMLKNIFVLGAHLEDVFFAIAGNGYQFRGTVMNSSLYCRPITGFGPPIVPVDGHYEQVFNIEDCLAAKTLEEFWRVFGGFSVGRETKYHPSRYVWLNLLSLLLHGTLEFRPFNITTCSKHIQAEIDLCVAFAKFCLMKTFTSKEIFDFEPHSIYDCRPVADVEETLVSFAHTVDLDRRSLTTLIDLVRINPPVRIEPGYVLTHVEQRKYPPVERAGFSGKRVPSSLVRTVRVVDIHTLRGEH